MVFEPRQLSGDRRCIGFCLVWHSQADPLHCLTSFVLQHIPVHSARGFYFQDKEYLHQQPAAFESNPHLDSILRKQLWHYRSCSPNQSTVYKACWCKSWIYATNVRYNSEHWLSAYELDNFCFQLWHDASYRSSNQPSPCWFGSYRKAFERSSASRLHLLHQSSRKRCKLISTHWLC